MSIAETRFSRKRGAGGPGTARPAAPRPSWARQAHSCRAAHRAAATKTRPKAETSQGRQSPSVSNGFPSSKMRPHMAPSPRPETVLKRKFQPFLQLDNVPAGTDSSGSRGNFRGFSENSCGLDWLGMLRARAGSVASCPRPSAPRARGDEARGGKSI